MSRIKSDKVNELIGKSGFFGDKRHETKDLRSGFG